MILKANIEEKTMGSKLLLKDLHLSLEANQKIAIIGRNGVGKSTFLGLLNGTDDEYLGEVWRKKGLRIATSRQEHAQVGDMTVLGYILSELPNYMQYKKIIDGYPDLKDPTDADLNTYTEALEHFAELDYYRAEDNVLQALAKYQINSEMARGLLKQLSGGQKRFMELVKIAVSDVDLALIDEPTNHMDYVAKAEFIAWLGATKEAVVLVSHDRDVLANVDVIVEIKDHKAIIFPGNYDAYLKQNSTKTVSGINQYEVAQSTLRNLHDKLKEAKRKKSMSAHVSPNPFIPIINRLEREIAKIEATQVKPSFWVDQESIDLLPQKVTDQYDKYKAKNIAVQTSNSKSGFQSLLQVHDLSIGYGTLLFDDVSFGLSSGDRVEIRGRNGAGKSSLIKLILDTVAKKPLEAQVYAGYVEPERELRLGYYEQEVVSELLEKTLAEAIAEVYHVHDVAINPEKIMRIAAQYLFDPRADLSLKLNQLSGGQKARFQLIKMLVNEPNLLVLDEPTNHLDLPSIEELEKALVEYSGAILYVSHDNYFRDKLKGEVIQI